MCSVQEYRYNKIISMCPPFCLSLLCIINMRNKCLLKSDLNKQKNQTMKALGVSTAMIISYCIVYYTALCNTIQMVQQIVFLCLPLQKINSLFKTIYQITVTITIYIKNGRKGLKLIFTMLLIYLPCCKGYIPFTIITFLNQINLAKFSY